MEYPWLMLGDCLERMKEIPDSSVDMILCDLPYGTTACKWDVVIPFEPLWEHYLRIIKGYAPIVLFGNEPFSSRLRLNKTDIYKYDWVWEKSDPAGFVNAKLKPIKNTENIMVFSLGATANGSTRNMPYFPQGLLPFNKVVNGQRTKHHEYSFARKSHKSDHYQEWTNYPKSILKFSSVSGKQRSHPTQKPVALLEYLVKTYTNENEIVLDNTMGSGSTGVACVNTKRKFIGIEKDEKYFAIAENRIKAATEDPLWLTYPFKGTNG